MRKVFALWIQKSRDRVSVQPGPEGANVELVQLADALQERVRSRPEPGVVPGTLLAVELEVVDLLHVGLDVLVGRVNKRLIEINK